MRLIVDVRVKDLERAARFYTEMLGLVCRRKEKDWAAITVGNAEIHLYLDGGISGDVEFYVEDIDLEVEKLKKRGVVFISGAKKPRALGVDKKHITLFPWGRTAFFKDSEGNELALVRDNK